jgi:hypothetical protein
MKNNKKKSFKREIQAEDAKIIQDTPNVPTKEKIVPAKPPNVFKMMKSFGKDMGKYLVAGAPNCSTEDYKDRLLTCDTCPHLMRNAMRCGKCGCLVEHKAKWRTTSCPENKWKAQDISDLKAAADAKAAKEKGEDAKK